MSFQMIHMEVAYRVMKRFGISEGMPEFILGSVLPDSVHMRDDYSLDQKIRSHLFEGCGPWGEPDDYTRWMENINAFRDKYIKKAAEIKEKMLIEGIFVHCITDYWNDITIWNGTRREYVPAMPPDEFKEMFYKEAAAIDKWLYQNSEHTEEIMELLSSSDEMGLEGYYTAEDAGRIKNHLLNVQYNVPEVDISGFMCFTEDKLSKFLDDVSAYISIDL